MAELEQHVPALIGLLFVGMMLFFVMGYLRLFRIVKSVRDGDPSAAEQFVDMSKPAPWWGEKFRISAESPIKTTVTTTTSSRVMESGEAEAELNKFLQETGMSREEFFKNRKTETVTFTGEDAERQMAEYLKNRGIDFDKYKNGV
jgi:hypothetical protein